MSSQPASTYPLAVLTSTKTRPGKEYEDKFTLFEQKRAESYMQSALAHTHSRGDKRN